MCIFCEENERKLLVDQQTIRQTDRPSASKQYTLFSSKGSRITYMDVKLKTVIVEAYSWINEFYVHGKRNYGS